MLLDVGETYNVMATYVDHFCFGSNVNLKCAILRYVAFSLLNRVKRIQTVLNIY